MHCYPIRNGNGSEATIHIADMRLQLKIAREVAACAQHAKLNAIAWSMGLKRWICRGKFKAIQLC